MYKLKNLYERERERERERDLLVLAQDSLSKIHIMSLKTRNKLKKKKGN